MSKIAKIYTKKGKRLVMVVVVKAQLCTCRLRAGVVPGVGATVATTGTVLHVQLFLRCVVSLFRLFQLSLWQQPAFHNGPTSTYKPSSTVTHHPHRTIIHDHSCITSSVVTKTSVFLPASCYLLGTGCLSGASSAPSPSDEGLTGSTE